MLQWTRDWKRAQELAWLVATAYAQLLGEIEGPLPGVVDWLQLVHKNNVPCALVRPCLLCFLLCGGQRAGRGAGGPAEAGERRSSRGRGRV